MKKRIITIILLLIMSALFITPTFAIVKPSKAFYVADYANVINASTEEYIIDSNGMLESDYSGAQIVVVSVEYLDGLYADEYALKVMNDWGVGSSSKDNGMVLLFSTKEKKGWLATGDGIDEAFTDEIANEYMDKYFWKEFDKGNYDKAVKKLYLKLEKWYVKHHYDVVYRHKTVFDDSAWVEYIIFFGLFAGIGVYFYIQSKDHVPNYEGRNFLGGYSDDDDDYYNSYHRSYHSSYRSSSGSSRSSGGSRSRGGSRSSGGGRSGGSGRGGGGRSGGGGGGRR